MKNFIRKRKALKVAKIWLPDYICFGYSDAIDFTCDRLKSMGYDNNIVAYVKSKLGGN